MSNVQVPTRWAGNAIKRLAIESSAVVLIQVYISISYVHPNLQAKTIVAFPLPRVLSPLTRRTEVQDEFRINGSIIML